MSKKVIVAFALSFIVIQAILLSLLYQFVQVLGTLG